MDSRDWSNALLAFVMCVSGGVVRLLLLHDKYKLNWKRCAADLFISGFAGMLMFLIATHMGISGTMIGALCGVMGLMGYTAVQWLGPLVKNVITAMLAKSIGVDVGDIRVQKDSEDSSLGREVDEDNEPKRNVG